MLAIKNAVLVMRDHLIPDAVLFIENGKTYRIIATTDVSTTDMSVHVYNQLAYNQVQNNQEISAVNVSASWKGTADYTFKAEQLNNSNAKVIRLSFRLSPDNPTITENFIDKICVYEVTA